MPTLSIHIKMTPQKRKADAASPAESSDESPYKRARSESTDDTAHKQVGYSHSSNESPDRYTEHSVPVAKPSARLAPGNGSDTAFQGDLPHTWDQASAADILLVDMKEENTKRTWTRIEENWERSTGERPAEGILQDRYRRLKAIRAHSEAGGAVGRKVRTKVVKESLKTSDDVSTLSTTKVRLSGRVTRGPLHKSSNAVTKRPTTAAKLSNPANERKSDESSRPIPKDSKTAAKLPKTASAAPASEITPELDLPQSWEQATAGDQLIVTMKTNRRGWARIENAWQNLTGKKPTEGALQDRYEHIKALIIRPGTNGASKYRYPVKASSFDGASDQVVPRRAKPALRAPRKRKAEAEPSEESLDESSDQSLEESSDESSYGTSKRSITMARRKRRGAIEQRKRASASDGPLDERVSNRTKTTAEEPSDGRAQSESSHASDEILKDSVMVARSSKRPRTIPAIAANSGSQNTAETANGMVVEMKERGCSWVEISKAWTERTGFTHAPETLRKRHARLKKGFAPKINSTGQASSNRKVNVASPDEGSYDVSAKRSKSTAETPRVTEFPVKRNLDRGKRKSSVKYTDSTTDEDELFAAPTEPVATTTDPAKRNAGRAAKVNRSDPEWLVTNEKSPLAYEDLHAEFSNSKTYENFTKSDWEDLRETLPPNVPINPDGFSIPMSFFKYDPDFRRGIREFQEDLASGRLDPKWQADAAQAMEERSQGAFDAYKESQFEAFWGQKQKLGRDALAGESTKIKLDLLIQNEIFKVGDYFSYSRVFGRGKNGVLVEKDCKVGEVLKIVLVCRRLSLTGSRLSRSITKLLHSLFLLGKESTLAVCLNPILQKTLSSKQKQQRQVATNSCQPT